MPDVLSPEQKEMFGKLRARLAADRSPGLEPARDEAGRARYREELLAWLGE